MLKYRNRFFHSLSLKHQPKLTNFSCVMLALTDKSSARASFVCDEEKKNRRKKKNKDNKCLCLIDNYHHLSIKPFTAYLLFEYFDTFFFLLRQQLDACTFRRFKNCAKKSCLYTKIVSDYMTCLFKQVCWNCKEKSVCESLEYWCEGCFLFAALWVVCELHDAEGKRADL